MKIIPATAEHVPFIAATWLKSMRFAPEYADMADDDYYSFAKQHVNCYMQEAACLVATDPEDSEIVVGYIVFSNSTLHWAYVRKEWRNLGVYKQLSSHVELEEYDHRSNGWRHNGDLSYRPWFTVHVFPAA